MQGFWKRFRYIHLGIAFWSPLTAILFALFMIAGVILGALYRFYDPLPGAALGLIVASVVACLYLLALAAMAAAFDDTQVITDVQHEADGTFSMTGTTSKKGKVIFIVPK